MSPLFGFFGYGVDLVVSSSLRKRSMHLTKSLTHSVGGIPSQHARGDVGAVARFCLPPTANERGTEHRCIVRVSPSLTHSSVTLPQWFV